MRAICLAHQLRDCQYAIDHGDQELGQALTELFLNAIEIGKTADSKSGAF